MPQLQSYWPSEQNVTACILTEAESLADSQLLAVHEAMRLDPPGTLGSCSAQTP